ncbi:MAG: HflC protein [Gammaproteobacteria bacterium]|nr:HflC protein [Gammaproteobacteria bacterium]|tara:strand:+ start:6990 stop:7844 length:855 start_codon:yes stop_codon:yes gene_type:complete
MNKSLIIFLGGLFFILWSTVFYVKETEKAIVFQLGEIKRDNLAPGIHFKVPFVNNVRKFDARILTLDAKPELFLTSEKKNMEVDFFVKWRIANEKTYYKATLGDRVRAESRITQIVKDELKNQFGIRTIQQAISGERKQIMSNLEEKAQILASELGILLVDTRISRIELPSEVSESVYDRMRAERSRTAKDFRARGQETAEKIRAEADKRKTIIIAEAYRTAEKERGLGDAKAAKVYADAYNKDPEFYSFTRSLTAYIKTFRGKNDFLIVEPDSEFFKYFKGKE